MSTSGINKTIYPGSPDRRKNLYAEAALDEVKLQGRSVACMIHSGYLQQTPNGSQLQHAKTFGTHFQLDQHAKFYDELTAGTGTAFLVSSDLVLTAAHCVCTNAGLLDHANNQSTRFVFDFHMLGDKQCQETFDVDCVYSIKKVVAHCFVMHKNRKLDWALVKLDRQVTGRVPLDLDFQSMLNEDTDVDVLGHPSGLPLKYTNDAKIKKIDHADCFEADLDTFGGNSGSPVFNTMTRKVIGILVRGLTDYETVTNADGMSHKQPHRATDAEIKFYGYEKCTRLSVIDTTFQMYIKASNGKADDQYQLGLHYLQQNTQKKGISWLQKAAYLGHVEAQKKLKELHACQLINVDPLAPIHRQPVKGLNFEAICIAQGCLENGNTVYIKKGMVAVDLKRTFYDLQCPSCDMPVSVQKITSLLFWDCQFTLDGRAHPNYKIEHMEKAKNQKAKVYALDNSNLIYLNTETN